MPHRILLIALALCLSAGAAVNFIPPDPGKALFRRDQLPIDPDTMRLLSAQLSVLAARPAAEEPEELRATAQLLALAGRLDPANPRVRTLILLYTDKRFPPAADPAELAQAKLQTWRIQSWLQQDKAGKGGRQLAAQLVDALRIVDPQHPIATRQNPGEEKKRWKGVVAPLSQFAGTQPKKPIDPSPPEPAPLPEPPKIQPDPQPSRPEPTAPPIRLRKGAVRTPLWVFGERYRLVLRIVPLSCQIHESDLAGTLTFRLNPIFKSPTHQAAQEQVRNALLTLWPELPKQEFAIINTDEQRYASRNGTALSGPAALFLHSALSGKALRKDLVFIGEVQSDASLKPPAASWDYLSALRPGAGGRLLIPPGLEDQLLALLTLHGPEVFLKYEILRVASLDAALQIGSTEDDPDDLANASAVFAEIQKAIKNRNLGPLLALESVRDRLNTVIRHAPNHLSAAMLLRYGISKKQPLRLPKPVLALEVTRALKPISWIIRADLRGLSSPKILASYEASREQLVALQQHAHVDDQVFLSKARAVIELCRSLARELQKTGSNIRDRTSPSAKIMARIRTDHESLQRAVADASKAPAP